MKEQIITLGISSLCVLISIMVEKFCKYKKNIEQDKISSLKKIKKTSTKKYFSEKSASEKTYYFVQGIAKLEDIKGKPKEKSLYAETRDLYINSSDRSFNEVKNNSIHYFHKFMINSNGINIEIFPNKDVQTFGIVREGPIKSTFKENFIQFITSICKQITGKIFVRKTKVEICDGDLISVFGESCYNKEKNFISITKPFYICGGGIEVITSIIKNKIKCLDRKSQIFSILKYGFLVIGIVEFFLILKHLYQNYKYSIIKEENQQSIPIEKGNQCIICLENVKDTMLYPCMHSCICYQCYSKLSEKKCPICKQMIYNIIRIRFEQQKSSKMKTI